MLMELSKLKKAMFSNSYNVNDLMISVIHIKINLSQHVKNTASSLPKTVTP